MILFLALIDDEEDKEKFVRLYEKYRYFLWYLANERLHDAGLAEDAVQETFFALIRHMEKIGDVDSSATRNFLATIVKRKAVDILRKHREEPVEEIPEENGGEKSDVLDDCICRESYEALLQAISKLDEIYRVVFELRYLHELSEKETADILGVTPKTVNVRIFRARNKLQKILAETGGAR